MGKRGPKSSAPGGYGTISANGYRRVWCTRDKRLRMEHRVIWERERGTIPDGMQVHHINGDKLDNRIENLELVDSLTHKRMHSGCELRSGVWWKPCRKCGEFHAIDHYYKRKSGVSPWCRQCCIANAVENKRRRRKKARDASDG